MFEALSIYLNRSSDVKRFLKGVFVGGFSAVVALFALMMSIALSSQPEIEYFNLTAALIVLVASSALAVWATGFWGRWGMILFFILAPVILVVDFSMNPLFPAGTIIFAMICYGSKWALKSNA